jgi:hypothetical protein
VPPCACPVGRRRALPEAPGQPRLDGARPAGRSRGGGPARVRARARVVPTAGRGRLHTEFGVRLELSPRTVESYCAPPADKLGLSGCASCAAGHRSRKGDDRSTDPRDRGRSGAGLDGPAVRERAPAGGGRSVRPPRASLLASSSVGRASGCARSPGALRRHPPQDAQSLRAPGKARRPGAPLLGGGQAHLAGSLQGLRRQPVRRRALLAPAPGPGVAGVALEDEFSSTPRGAIGSPLRESGARAAHPLASGRTALADLVGQALQGPTDGPVDETLAPLVHGRPR